MPAKCGWMLRNAPPSQSRRTPQTPTASTITSRVIHNNRRRIGGLRPFGSRCALRECREERHHGIGKEIVAIARHHVSRLRDVDVAGVRHEREKVLRAVLGEDVALSSADQQGRHGQAARGGGEAWRIGDVRGRSRAAEEARIPMPAPTAVGSLAETLGEAAELARPRPVRQIRRDDVGGLLEAREAVREMPS